MQQVSDLYRDAPALAGPGNPLMSNRQAWAHCLQRGYLDSFAKRLLQGGHVSHGGCPHPRRCSAEISSRTLISPFNFFLTGDIDNANSYIGFMTPAGQA